MSTKEIKAKACQEYLKTVYVPLIDTENVEAMLYNMRAMAFSAGYDAKSDRDFSLFKAGFEAAREKDSEIMADKYYHKYPTAEDAWQEKEK